MKTQALVVADDPVYLNWLQNAVDGVEFSLLRVLDAEDLIERVRAISRVDMVFFQFDPGTAAQRAEMIERFLDRFGDLPVVAIGAEHAPETVLAAMRAGARDFFVLRRDADSIAQSLGKLLRRTAQTAQAGRSATKGKLVAVVSGYPDESIAFTAQHLALAAMQGLPAGERVLLMDAATPAGAAAIFLNIAQSYSLLDAINDVYRCDQTLVDTAFARHPGGLYLLSLPEDFIGRPLFSAEEFLKLAQILRGLFPLTVVALDGHLPMPVLNGVITQADRTLLVTDQSILKSRHSKYLLRALRLEGCPLDRCGLVVDRYRKRLGLEPQNLAEILDLPLLGVLGGGEGGSREHAMNSGESLFVAAPKDAYCTDIRTLARHVLSGETRAPEPPQGFLARLLG